MDDLFIPSPLRLGPLAFCRASPAAGAGQTTPSQGGGDEGGDFGPDFTENGKFPWGFIGIHSWFMIAKLVMNSNH